MMKNSIDIVYKQTSLSVTLYRSQTSLTMHMNVYYYLSCLLLTVYRNLSGCSSLNLDTNHVMRFIQ